MVKPIIFIVLLLVVFSSTTYAITSTDDYLQCVTKTILENCISVYEIQNFTEESIFNFLKDFENKLPKGNILFDRREVLICEIPNDFMRLRRYDTNRYSLEYFPSGEQNLIDCPRIINKEYYFIKFEPSISFFSFSPFSINLFPITISTILLISFFSIKKYIVSIRLKIYKK